MYVPDRITCQLKTAATKRQVVDIILDKCFSAELQDAALDWCITHRPELGLDDQIEPGDEANDFGRDPQPTTTD